MNKKYLYLIIALFLPFIIFESSLAETLNTEKLETKIEPYLIGPNDLLNIFVWREPELTQDLVVMPDGRITFPMIGEVMAQGKTTSALKDIITEKLKDFVTAPEVTVIVRESRSRMIYTIGKLNQPGPFPLTPGMTVLQALSIAGGFAEWADVKKILILRRAGEKEIQIPFNYKDFIEGKNPEQNIILNPNDTIVVP
ncbi:MAG: polysaccharide biosynthesis/export family protein [Deltaproteobacteria bacterium]|nr:polysaccharide biosynthesis/export family protein [Deltaproteobacteria bacterium]